MNDHLQREITARVKARRYERSPQRQGNRRGHYARSLATRYPLLEKLQLPPVQEGATDFQHLNTYQPRRSEVDAAIGRLFLEGVNVRTLRAVAKQLLDREASATAVSNPTSSLDDELQHLQTKPLTDDFSFLWLDGMPQKMAANGAEKKVMLCSLGLKEDGTNEMLAFRLVDQEDTDGWRAFLVDIKSRGLLGKALKLITTDDNPALLKALKEAYPSVKLQGCIVLKLRNVAVTLKRVHVKRCMAEAKDIFNTPSRGEAIKRFKAWQEKWQAEEEKAVRCLANDFYHCLHYYSFPKELWTKIRSTNMLEREFRDVRRRTRPTGLLPAEASASQISIRVTNGIQHNEHRPLPAVSAETLI